MELSEPYRDQVARAALIIKVADCLLRFAPTGTIYQLKALVNDCLAPRLDQAMQQAGTVIIQYGAYGIVERVDLARRRQEKDSALGDEAILKLFGIEGGVAPHQHFKDRLRSSLMNLNAVVTSNQSMLNSWMLRQDARSALGRTRHAYERFYTGIDNDEQLKLASVDQANAGMVAADTNYRNAAIDLLSTIEIAVPNEFSARIRAVTGLLLQHRLDYKDPCSVN